MKGRIGTMKDQEQPLVTIQYYEEKPSINTGPQLTTEQSRKIHVKISRDANRTHKKILKTISKQST